MREMKDSGVEWLGEVPAGWALRQAGQLADQTKVPNEGMIETNLLSLSYGKVKRRDINATDGLLPASFETYNVIEPNDIVLRFTDLQNDQKSLRVGRATERGIITSAYVTVRPLNPSYSRFMYYALHAYDLRKGFYGMGAGVRQGLKWQEAKYIKLPWPDDAERGRIADFLDEKCGEIDRAISAAERSIEEYKAYKNSVVNQTITKGLSSDAPMKDSGVEWLGEVPTGWALRQAGQLADQTKVPNEGMIETNLLSLSYGKVKRRDINATDGLLPASFETYNVIEPNDIVLRFTDLQNDQKSLRVGRATERGIITSAYVTVRPLNPSYSRFMYYALHAYDLRKGFYGMGAGVRQGLKWQEAKYIKLPWPDDAERGRIADFLDEKCGEIDAAIVTKQAIIADLKAYRQSLIYETVTGKREV